MLKSPSVPTGADAAEFARERLGLSAEQAGGILVMSMLLLAVVGITFGAELDTWHWIAGGFVASVYLLRYRVSKRFLEAEHDKKNQSAWTRIFFGLATLSGLSWGIFAMLLVSLQSAEADIMGVFLVVALTAGAISTLGALAWTYSSYLGSIILPAMVAFGGRDHRFGFAFALLALAYIVFLLVSARNFRRRLDTWMNHARENAQLMHFSRHDRLTGLLNKAQFVAQIQGGLEQGAKTGKTLALLNVDLDQFKVINDTCGHATGDQLLQQAAQFMHGLVRERDIVGRLGGDEFGILLDDCSPQQANRIAAMVCRSLKRHRFIAGDRSFRLTVSIGVALTGGGISSLPELLRAAEAASYAAKDSGRDRVHVYHHDDDLLFRRNREMQWALEIPDALAENRFYLDSQAIVPVASDGADDGWYEILLRMCDQDDNTVMPGEFLPAAERYNLASRLDLWVIETLLEMLATDSRLLHRTGLCFVNLSGQSMGDPGFMNRVCALLGKSSVPGHRLCFEITETAAVENLDQALALMRRLQGLGCRFALDDFGSGLSSFGYLRDFPVDFIKIDGAFVRDMTNDPVNHAIVSSITQIGHSANKRIIAEFVENEGVLECLREIGVDYAQGYGIELPRRFPEPGRDREPQLLSA